MRDREPYRRILGVPEPWMLTDVELDRDGGPVAAFPPPDRLREASIKAVAEQMHLTWREVDGIQRRAVKRGRRVIGRRAHADRDRRRVV